MASRSERDELHKTIWAIANKLRGKVDGWDFKAYVLGTIFYRYISEILSRLFPMAKPIALSRSGYCSLSPLCKSVEFLSL